MSHADPARWEVLCHNDIAPYNIVIDENGNLAGIIDFDTVGPGPRAWDLAYALYRFVPFHTTRGGRDLGWSERIASAPDPLRALALLRGYGADEALADEALGMIPERLLALETLIQTRAKEGHAAFMAMLDDGHADLYADERRFVETVLDRVRAVVANHLAEREQIHSRRS